MYSGKTTILLFSCQKLLSSDGLKTGLFPLFYRLSSQRSVLHIIVTFPRPNFLGQKLFFFSIIIRNRRRYINFNKSTLKTIHILCIRAGDDVIIIIPNGQLKSRFSVAGFLRVGDSGSENFLVTLPSDDYWRRLYNPERFFSIPTRNIISFAKSSRNRL